MSAHQRIQSLENWQDSTASRFRALDGIAPRLSTLEQSQTSIQPKISTLENGVTEIQNKIRNLEQLTNNVSQLPDIASKLQSLEALNSGERLRSLENSLNTAVPILSQLNENLTCTEGKVAALEMSVERLKNKFDNATPSPSWLDQQDPRSYVNVTNNSQLQFQRFRNPPIFSDEYENSFNNNRTPYDKQLRPTQNKYFDPPTFQQTPLMPYNVNALYLGSPPQSSYESYESRSRKSRSRRRSSPQYDRSYEADAWANTVLPSISLGIQSGSGRRKSDVNLVVKGGGGDAEGRGRRRRSERG